MEDYVADYKINLFEIAYLTDKQVNMFRSDFKYVAEYFVESRKQRDGITPSFTFSLEHIKHVEEFIELMNAMTNSKKFSDLPIVIEEMSNKTMWTYLFDECEAQISEQVEARVTAQSIARGENKMAKLISILLKQGRTEDAGRSADDPDYRKQLYQEFQIA